MDNTEIDILLVEDSTLDAEVTIRALKKSNISNVILHLSDGVKALDFLFGIGEYAGRNTKNKPKLIMLDLKMPKVDGIEVLTRIKSDASLKKIPVVILTSSNEHPDIEKCYELGANSYIVKPVGFQNFMSAIGQSGMYWMLINHPPEV